MASVFLSYDREDRDKARSVALALEKAGHSVFWDLHIRSGTQFTKVIDEALNAAEAVVVLWSERSIESAWVRDEATVGRDTGRLVPVTIDGTEPPLGFRQFQTIDLSGWRGRGKPPQLRVLLDDVSAIAGAQASEPAGETQRPTSAAEEKAARERFAWNPPIVAALGLAVVAVLAVLAWKLIDRPSSTPVVAVAAADPSPTSQALARDLLVKLGTLQSARPNSIDLVSQDDSAKKPGLIFQVARSGPRVEANLALTDASNRSLLWSKDYRDPNGNEADLRQQLGYSAARVLRCALETKDPSAGRLSRQAVKTYLNACAPSSDAGVSEFTSTIESLRQLVREAPRFAGGWAKLLSAESVAVTDLHESEARAMRPVLARHIVEARKLHPSLAEAYIAEVALTPGARFLERGRLLDQAIERNPNHVELRGVRSLFLQNVGRVEESLQDARRAVDLDPLSPALREGYILSLAFAGRMDEALAQLDEAERLWPSATGLRLTRYTLHLRAGDPREALRLLRAGVLQHDSTPWVRIQETLLLARIDRSPQKVEEALQTARTRYNQIPQSIGALAQTLVEFDREEELFQILLNWRRMELAPDVTYALFRPKFRNLHNDPRFMEIANRLGLLNYWRTTGKWPDFCSRADLPYDCRTEAAKHTV